MPWALATCRDIESAETRAGLAGTLQLAAAATLAPVPRLCSAADGSLYPTLPSLARFAYTRHLAEQYFAVEFLAKNVFPQYLQVNSRIFPAFHAPF